MPRHDMDFRGCGLRVRRGWELQPRTFLVEAVLLSGMTVARHGHGPARLRTFGDLEDIVVTAAAVLKIDFTAGGRDQRRERREGERLAIQDRVDANRAAEIH